MSAITAGHHKLEITCDVFSTYLCYTASGKVPSVQRVRSFAVFTIIESQTNNEAKMRLRKCEQSFTQCTFTLLYLPSHAINWSGVAQCGCEQESEYTVGPTGLTVIAHN